MRILITEYFTNRLSGRFGAVDLFDLVFHLSEKLKKVMKQEE
jgi:hypothetical protein